MALPNPLGPSGVGLGDLLAQQVTDETEEERRKRMLEMRVQPAGPLSNNMGGMTRARALSSVYSGAY